MTAMDAASQRTFAAACKPMRGGTLELATLAGIFLAALAFQRMVGFATQRPISSATRGRQSGATVMLRRRLGLPDSAGGHVLDAVDWLYLAGNGAILDRSVMRKFGIKVAERVATMRPAPREAIVAE